MQFRTQIPVSKSNNPIDYIHPTIKRFLNRQKNNKMQVYTDRESVHNSNVQESIRESIINILKD